VWSPDGRSILTTSNDRLLRLWDLPPQDFALLKIKAASRPDAIVWSPDGRRIEARGTTLEAWDSTTGEAVSPAPSTDSDLPKGAVISHDRSVYVIKTGPAGQFEFRDLATGQRRGLAVVHPGARNPTTMNFVFSRDSRWLLSVPHDSTVGSCAAEMWDVATGRALGFDLRHSDGILGAAFSPNGQFIATASEDTTAKLWRTRDGAPVGTFAPHGYWVWDVAFSPDSTRLASVSSDHTANVWDVRTLAALTPKLPHDRIAQRVSWSPDGHRLATADSAGTIRVWSLEPETKSVDELRREVRRLFEGEAVKAGGPSVK
jgi:WD40 repeat protein